VMQKPCIRCGEVFPLTSFYSHSQMANGTLNKCKSCCRADAIANRLKRLDYYRQYDVDRFSTPERKAWLSERQRRYRAANPIKNAARAAVAKAISSGCLTKMPCEVCGSTDTDAHHDDYSMPLSVRWLCRVHHLIEHGQYRGPIQKST
jgi:hypothetical protein